MSEHAFRNHGELFDNESLTDIVETPEWNAEKIEDVRRALEEHLERREQLVEEVGDLNEMQTRFYWVSNVLRALGYTFSVAELTPNDDDTRPDFTLFYAADDFRNAIAHRGEREYFAQVLTVVRAFAWDASLDEYAPGTEGPSNPAYEIDKMIRATGVNFGIMTNGRLWRLYHRDTSGLFSTYFEVDLVEALQSANQDEFKYFWAIFSPEGIGGYDANDPLVLRLLH